MEIALTEPNSGISWNRLCIRRLLLREIWGTTVAKELKDLDEPAPTPEE